MIYILQTSSVVCLCSLNSGCHDESTHNVPSHLASHCFAMMSYATISGPILLFSIKHPRVDAPTAHCVILQKLSHRLISIYTILYIYIVDDVPARICIYLYVLYYLQNSTQFILLLDPPTGSQYNTDSELWRVKRKLYYMKPSSQSPFLFSSNFGKGHSHATRLMTVYISRAVAFKDCVFGFSDQGC